MREARIIEERRIQKIKITFSNTKDNDLWIKHIISGIFFLPLLLWFILSVIQILKDPINTLPIFFYSPVNVIFGILFSVTALYHGNFEIKYLIAENRQDDAKRIIYMVLSDFVCIITGLAVIMAILQLHFVSLI